MKLSQTKKTFLKLVLTNLKKVFLWQGWKELSPFGSDLRARKTEVAVFLKLFHNFTLPAIPKQSETLKNLIEKFL